MDLERLPRKHSELYNVEKLGESELELNEKLGRVNTNMEAEETRS